jgi:hypothetical protein
MAKPRIALIHATPVAVDPIHAAMKAGWPEAEPVNILEDSLSPDRAAAGCISEELFDRIAALTRYAEAIGSDGILFTCSAFGAAIERAASLAKIPVLKPNEAMYEAAMDRGDNLAMIVTFPPAEGTMIEEFDDEARLRPQVPKLTTFLVEEALIALKSGDDATHNRLVSEKAGTISGYDALMLAHFSTSRAAADVRRRTAIPVLTSPDTAVAKLKRLITGKERI